MESRSRDEALHHRVVTSEAVIQYEKVRERTCCRGFFTLKSEVRQTVSSLSGNSFYYSPYFRRLCALEVWVGRVFRTPISRAPDVRKSPSFTAHPL